ncbi:nucleotide-binding universal stress UspA family protein [Halohasta litchfieldiae]|jgi:nucleotide-binding universal stress UspA family protein|uniref:Nucleotide-binding universal stress protein, UspA family n=1 Tax=Halohasta litchfieldiae TaxID=1073996 RepID=A0A1H6RE41_9EURY|nr:universal stress protein [Halohasta litchfieldiae]ATW89786.1 nucleotide-binding universal stress UspA family protein [Halohasta litchfieldiae]SEI52736.1 Nucleotide-binding universal stress protein, UspA family [Halohasta litchfieldiae]
MLPSHVLVPLDGSPLADEALQHALAAFDCRVTVLNIVTPLDAGMSEGGILEPDESRQADARERADQLIKTAKAEAAAADRSVETTVETGDPASAIVDYAEQHTVDHIVMGGHGGERGELARRLLGTVATAVLGEAPVTVTVVR